MENFQILQRLAGGTYGEKPKTLGCSVGGNNFSDALAGVSNRSKLFWKKKEKKKDGTYYIINYILNALFVVLFF